MRIQLKKEEDNNININHNNMKERRYIVSVGKIQIKQIIKQKLNEEREKNYLNNLLSFQTQNKRRK
jgi:hypothetical protein